jgi:hypothetical protein
MYPEKVCIFGTLPGQGNTVGKGRLEAASKANGRAT